MDKDMIERELLSKAGVVARAYDFQNDLSLGLEAERLGETIYAISPLEQARRILELRVAPDFAELRQGEPAPSRGRSRLNGCRNLAVDLYESFMPGLNKKHAISRHNDEVLENLKSDSVIVFLVHGLFQNEASTYRLVNGLYKKGFSPVTIGYNWRNHPEQSTWAITKDINTIMKQAPEEAVKIILGHSSGADFTRYAVSQGKLHADGYLFGAGIVNGKVPDIVDRVLFGKIADFTSPDSEKGREVLEMMQKPVPNSISVIGMRDAFVPPASSVYLKGRNVFLRDYGHMAHVHDAHVRHAYSILINHLNREALEARSDS
jgi:hypothetical protein